MSEPFLKSAMIHLDAKDFPFALSEDLDGTTSGVFWVQDTTRGPQVQGHFPHNPGSGVNWDRRDVVLIGEWLECTKRIFECYYCAKAAYMACSDPARLWRSLAYYAGSVHWMSTLIEATAGHLGDLQPQTDQVASDSFIKKWFIAPTLMVFAAKIHMTLNQLFENLTKPYLNRFLWWFANVASPDKHQYPYILPTASARNAEVIVETQEEYRERLKKHGKREARDD